jgi:hypothetical protein
VRQVDQVSERECTSSDIYRDVKSQGDEGKVTDGARGEVISYLREDKCYLERKLKLTII